MGKKTLIPAHFSYLFILSLAFSGNGNATESNPAPAGEACGSPLSQEDIKNKFCPEFTATPSIKSFQPAQKAAQACAKFYESALRGIDAACEHFKDAQEVSAEAAQTESLNGVVRQNGTAGDASNLYKSAVEKRKASLQRLSAAEIQIERSSYDFENSLKALGQDAEKIFQKEVTCGAKGEANAPAALILRGLVGVAEPDRGKNRHALVGALQMLKNSIISSIGNQARAQRQAESVRRNLGLSANQTKPGETIREDNGLPSPGSLAQRGTVQGSTPALVRSFSGIRASLTYGPLGSAFPSGAKAGPVLATGAVSISYRLVTQGSVDALGLASIGTGALATIISGNPWVGVGVGVMAQAVEDRIRASTPQGRAVAEYTRFAKTKLKENPGLTSSALAEQFFPEKEKICGSGVGATTRKFFTP